MSDEPQEETMRGPKVRGNAEVAELRAAVAALTAEVESLRKLYPTPSDAQAGPPARPNYIREAHQRLAEKKRILKAAEDAVREDLRRGPQKWWVYQNTYPKMREIVGAGSEAEAKTRFMVFNGITGFTNSKVKVVAEPYQEAAAA